MESSSCAASASITSSNCVTPPVGFVSLKDKLVPICEREASSIETKGDDEAFAFTLAIVDISKFKAKLLSLPQEMWEDENQEGNVRLVRPAHDNWGIRKIVFTFCDDFLLKVLDLPWSQLPEWRSLLLPIYAAIGVEEHRIVRCLLASMPPGVNIPVHHDTGYWVKRTHRCHLAIQTDCDKVNFLVGSDPDHMKKYLFDEGRIVELNNQAKHSVSNNMTDCHRIHLIFDYVDDDSLPLPPIKERRILLQPGEVVHQTRRSIDLANRKREDENSVGDTRKSPAFIVIGAQKSGTTSMYEYICQHPLVLKGKRRETHYFDWRFNHSIRHKPGTAEYATAHHEYYMNFYQQPVLEKHRSLVTGESTPSYLLHSDVVIDRMKAICPWIKLIVMLRNPADRAFSHYQMSVDPTGTAEQLKVRGQSSYCKKSFDEAIDIEIKQLEELGIDANCSSENFSSRYLSTVSHLQHGGHSLISRGLYCLQLDEWWSKWPNAAETIKIVSIQDIKGDVAGRREDRNKVQATLDEVFGHIGIPPVDVEDLSAKNTRQQTYSKNPDGGMSIATRQKLEAFYDPFNQRLFKMLGRELQW